MNGLVHPYRPKCQSANWSWVRALQLQPQGLGPRMDTRFQCDYGDVAPYTDPTFRDEMRRSLALVGPHGQYIPYRQWAGQPNICGKQQPIVYIPIRQGASPTSYAIAANAHTL